MNETGQTARRADLPDTIAAYNSAPDGTMRVPAEDAEIAIVKA